MKLTIFDASVDRVGKKCVCQLPEKRETEEVFV
jgi:hypothetical protein